MRGTRYHLHDMPPTQGKPGLAASQPFSESANGVDNLDAAAGRAFSSAMVAGSDFNAAAGVKLPVTVDPEIGVIGIAAAGGHLNVPVGFRWDIDCAGGIFGI